MPQPLFVSSQGGCLLCRRFAFSMDGAKTVSSVTIAMSDAFAKEVGGRTVKVNSKGFGACPPPEEAKRFGRASENLAGQGCGVG